MPSKTELLSACYRALLNREPDRLALAYWGGSEAEGGELDNMLKLILESEEFRARRIEFTGRYFGSDKLPFVNDHSQFGEIGLLVRRMVDTAARHRIVVDVGANGLSGSNSFDFMHHFGWRGLLIEANPNRNPIIEAAFAGLDFELVNLAVSDHAGEAVFYLGANDDVSSLVAETAQIWGDVKGKLTVRVERLPVILAEHGIPHDFDLLSIDAEGEDIRILNDTVAGGYLPEWVIIEASQEMRITALDQLPLTRAVREAYELVDRTMPNLLLKRKRNVTDD